MAESRSSARVVGTCILLGVLVPTLLIAADRARDFHHDTRLRDDGWREDPRVRQAMGNDDTGCITCHDGIENATENMGFNLQCTFCHGGDGQATTLEEAHVLPTLPVIMDNTVAPLDYDLDYQRFVNPTNLRVVEQTCGVCHFTKVENVLKSMMSTTAGHYAGGLYLNGVTDTKTPIYGTFAATDEDGIVPTEVGAVGELIDLLTYDPEADQSLVATHYAAVPPQACARCHLWSRGKGYRGAEDVDGTYRADGCAACHMPYANDGRTLSGDPMIDKFEQGHTKYHRVTRQIPTEQCLHCHHRGARIGLSFTGRGQMPPRLPSGPGVAGTTDERFNSNYHYTDQSTNPPDLHHEAGMHCIDCHVSSEIMGDGNIYGHMDQATKIECRQCHGTPVEPATFTDNDGIPLPNIAEQNGLNFLTSKVDGQQHFVKQLVDVVDPTANLYNPRASCAMNSDHIKSQGGLECYACHAAWLPNCFGCHFERNEQLMGQNLVTREWEVGKVTTNNKIFESFKHFSLGRNAEGRYAPYIVSCHPIADVTAPDGSKILDFAMPVTSNGLSGIGHNPVQPHTVRGPGEVRTCAECHRSPPSLGFGSGNYSIARDFAFTAADDGVLVFDRKADPASPVFSGTVPLGGSLALATLPDAVEGTSQYLYVATGAGGVAILDMAGGVPAGPVNTLAGINAIDLARTAQYLYVVVQGQGINIYDCSDPVAPVLAADVPIAAAQRVVPWGIHLFVAAGSSGLVIVDIADQTLPAVLHTVPGMNAVDVRLYAHLQKTSEFAARAYVADPDYGVHIIDLLPDFDTAILVDGVAAPGAQGLDSYTRYVLAHDDTPSREHDYLYVAAGTTGLHILDITDPDDIIVVATLPLGGSARHVDVSSALNPPGVDDYAIVANADLGMQIIDVNDPTAPALLDALAAPGAQRALVEVQQMDRFIDEQGGELKENSHPFIDVMTRADIVQLLSVPIDTCSIGACCLPNGGCFTTTGSDCSILEGTYAGADTDCVTGVCDIACAVAADCADQDDDGIRDNGCMWWSCGDEVCVGTEVVFADMGGQFGNCAPDGAADVNDRFHTLNCFADTDPNGLPGAVYACEMSAPSAVNVDAGGQFGSCVPDGVCDGNDAFYALNAFAGTSTCACPSDGNPAPAPPQVVDHTSVTLSVTPRRMRPNDVVEVEVYLDTQLADLRGYQLHVESRGGKAGTLDLMDIVIRGGGVFDAAPDEEKRPTRQASRKAVDVAPRAYWSAFNLATQQMVAGLDGGGVSTPAKAYLATFVFQASADARGTFVVELLHDDSNANQRTFLFPTPAHGRIEITGHRAASITVGRPTRQTR